MAVVPVAVLAGLLSALQSGANAHLSKELGQPFAAALIVVAVSATTLLLAGLISGHLHWPGVDRFREVPWWAWIGGACGAVFVMSQLFVAPVVGAGTYLGLTVTAAVPGVHRPGPLRPDGLQRAPGRPLAAGGGRAHGGGRRLGGEVLRPSGTRSPGGDPGPRNRGGMSRVHA